jgi:Raf kinase inhibitor-like YbhB/YbcL family protein
MRKQLLSLLVVAALPAVALAEPPGGSTTPTDKTKLSKRSIKPLKVTSSAFKANQSIPPDYTCDGASTPLPITWSAVPKNTRSIAILVDDPDAPGGSFTHWLVTGIAPTETQLPQGGALPAGAVAAKNGKGDPGYIGPCPPTGRHHYHVYVYALETTIPAPGSKDDFQGAIDGHILAQGELVGTYQKTGAPAGQSAPPTAPK